MAMVLIYNTMLFFYSLVEVPWRFPLRHGGTCTSTRMHARVSVTRYVELLFNNSCHAKGHDLQVS